MQGLRRKTLHTVGPPPDMHGCRSNTEQAFAGGEFAAETRAPTAAPATAAKNM